MPMMGILLIFKMSSKKGTPQFHEQRARNSTVEMVLVSGAYILPYFDGLQSAIDGKSNGEPTRLGENDPIRFSNLQ